MRPIHSSSANVSYSKLTYLIHPGVSKTQRRLACTRLFHFSHLIILSPHRFTNFYLSSLPILTPLNAFGDGYTFVDFEIILIFYICQVKRLNVMYSKTHTIFMIWFRVTLNPKLFTPRRPYKHICIIYIYIYIHYTLSIIWDCLRSKNVITKT